MKLALIITQNEPETVFNALRLAKYSLKQGDGVKIFLSGRGVDIERIADTTFDVRGLAREVLAAGGQFLACGTCLELRKWGGSDICPLSTMKDQYELIRDADKVITV